MKHKILFLIYIIFSLSVDARDAISGSRFELLTGVRKASDSSPSPLKGFWDKKFAGEKYIYGKAPAKFLARNYDFIPSGSRVLDIGMGEGRNAVFLATKGYKVTGIDISRVAVQKARYLAKEFGVRIDTIVKSIKELKIKPGSIDAIICFYYVDREIVKTLKKWLKPGGVIIFEAYTMNQKLINKMEGQDSYVLQEAELFDLFSNYKVLKYEEALHRKDYIASIVAQKPKK